MKKRIAFYRDRDGNEIDGHEAFQNGVLRDGVTITVPKAFRDSLSPLQRAVAADPDDVKRRATRVFDGRGKA